MALTQKTAINEVLFRFNPDGSVQGAHVIRHIGVVDDNGQWFGTPTALPAEAIDPNEIGSIVESELAAVSAENLELKKQVASRDEEIAGRRSVFDDIDPLGL
ncbi:MAG: hypothetical protein JKY92_04165 [Magnetovibrio sp.]|nr:hypothetical protein [Magnetovibrio sp.]